LGARKEAFKSLNCLLAKVQRSKKFIFTHCNSSNEASDAKNNFNIRGSDMRYLRCINLLGIYKIHAKGCNTYAGFDIKRVSEVIREGGGNLIGENASQQTLGKFNQNASQIEKESAEGIVANLENPTGNKPEIMSSKKAKVYKLCYRISQSWKIFRLNSGLLLALFPGR